MSNENTVCPGTLSKNIERAEIYCKKYFFYTQLGSQSICSKMHSVS